MNKLILGDNLVKMRELPDESVDLCVTSPPYKERDGYNPIFVSAVCAQVYRLLKPNSLFFLNFGHLAADKFRPFAVCLLAMNRGFHLNDTIIWVKNHYKPIQGKRRVNNLTEFIFVLYKGKMPNLNRLALGVPYKDKTNANRFAKGRDLKCGGNVWYIPYETITKSEDKLHKDRYPVELPERCIKLCGYPVNVVLDPYFGSGTTGVAAEKLGKSYIGIERDSDVFDTAFERLKISR